LRKVDIFTYSIKKISDEIRQSWHGDRMYTALGYIIGNQSHGGQTIFDHLGISVPVIQGSLLLWENLDPETLNPLKNAAHKSCPVLYGHKLVLNKWIRAYDQY
jgi:hypothetical protein